ncbi:MAG TPA: glutathione gamma-glutamylcysteinyltransferase [Alcaligenaceae bacterium]|jgi:hypothetical protein|nr:glutathione gamma-glutamylcysteinyltransferase [Alcaligenaceae bacterium]
MNMDYSDFFKQNRGNLWARRWWSVLPLVFIQICSSAFADPLYLDTVLGSERLLKADFNLPYFQVSAYVDAQENLGFCAPASIAAVLNSLQGVKRPIPNKYRRYGYFTQSDLFTEQSSQVRTYDAAAKRGFTLQQVSDFLWKLKIPNQIYWGDDQTIDNLRTLVKQSSIDPNQRLIVNFSRKIFSQEGDGHYSPVVAYDSDSDSVLIFDVAKFKYQPFWVTLEELQSSIQTLDNDSQRSRGLVVVIKPTETDGE